MSSSQGLRNFFDLYARDIYGLYTNEAYQHWLHAGRCVLDFSRREGEASVHALFVSQSWWMVHLDALHALAHRLQIYAWINKSDEQRSLGLHEAQKLWHQGEGDRAKKAHDYWYRVLLV